MRVANGLLDRTQLLSNTRSIYSRVISLVLCGLFLFIPCHGLEPSLMWRKRMLLLRF